MLDQEDRPVPSAAVKLTRPALGTAKTETSMVSTNADGSFFAKLLPAVDSDLEIVASGFEVLQEKVKMAENLERIFSLRRHPTFTVRVLDWKGNELDKFVVTGHAMDGREVVARSQVRGTYYATEYPFKIYGSALNRGLGVTTTEVITTYQPEIRLILEEGYSLRGFVRYSDGRPVQEYTFFLKPPGARFFDMGVPFFPKRWLVGDLTPPLE